MNKETINRSKIIKYSIPVLATVLITIIIFKYYKLTHIPRSDTNYHEYISQNPMELDKSEWTPPFPRRNGEDISIYVDFGIKSSKPRCFVYDNNYQQVVSVSKCAHGSGKGSTADNPVFSNAIGSNCSSLGTYRIRCLDKMHGNSSIDGLNSGIRCIRLDGLSSTNSNASARGIVIHEAPFFADDISIGIPIPATKFISQGCFCVSSSTFELLAKAVNSHKTIYLYAYCH